MARDPIFRRGRRMGWATGTAGVQPGKAPWSTGRGGWLWSYGWPLLALAASSACVVSVLAQEANPFIPPSQRQAEREGQLQQRVDKAMSSLEARIVQSLVNSLEGKGDLSGPESLLAAALKKAIAGNAPAFDSAGTGRIGRVGNSSLPALPPLPGSTQARDSAVPPGSQFIGCLDRKAFFQDQGGSPFLVDPAAFPPTSGPGTCGR